MSTMNEEQLKREAVSLAQIVTGPGIIEWLQSWINMNDDHPQYHLRDDQIQIGEMALKESNQ